MQALILAGGEGTRLRPLTSDTPKPVVPLVGRPFISFMIDWLRGHGVDDVVMSCGFLADGVRSVLGDGSALGVRLRYMEEPQPMGTGGAIKFAESLLDQQFLVLNGDVLTDIDLTTQIEQHKRVGAKCTLALTPVDNPSAYGLVRLNEKQEVLGFVEKPKPEQIDTNLINAGAYMMEREVLELMPPNQKVSIERDVFPKLVGDGLFGCPSDSYWLDIGTPRRYLTATADILAGRISTSIVQSPIKSQQQWTAPLFVHADCEVDPTAKIGAETFIGQGVKIDAQAVVEAAVVLEGAQIGPHCVVRDCIVGPGAQIGAHTAIDGASVIGAGVKVGSHNMLSAGARIFPGVSLPEGAIKF